LVALVGPLVTYLVAAKRLSGKIGSSEAEQLWEESSSIRREYAARIEQLTKTVRDCQRRMAKLERRNDALEKENADLKRAISNLKVEGGE
jgi:predicted RNase H-like nuclease (RuvC/YqgF family)